MLTVGPKHLTEQDLTNARAHLDRYGTARLNDVNTHCRNREKRGSQALNRHTDGKRAWVNQQPKAA